VFKVIVNFYQISVCAVSAWCCSKLYRFSIVCCTDNTCKFFCNRIVKVWNSLPAAIDDFATVRSFTRLIERVDLSEHLVLLTWYFVFLCHNKLFTYEYTAAFVLSFFMFNFFIVLLLLLCHICYCDACKCLHGLGICVWFYPNKLMMMMIILHCCSEWLHAH